MDNGVKYMLNNNMKEELKVVFTLLSNYPESLTYIAVEIEKYINDQVKTLYSKKDKTNSIISKYLFNHRF